MKHRRKTKGFTLIELAVAVGLLSMLVAFSAVIFGVCMDGHRTATANADILRRLRVITEQLNSDFSGMCKDAPVLIKFGFDNNDPNTRDDQIMFFASGDFQSIQMYDENTGEPLDLMDNTSTGDAHTIRGNTARVYYGIAASPDPNGSGLIAPMDIDAGERVFARRRHILTAKLDTGATTLEGLEFWPFYDDIEIVDLFNDTTNYSENTYNKNELYEHDSMSLAQWKTIDLEYYANNKARIVRTCFGNVNNNLDRAEIDMADPLTYHKLLCEHIGSFAIQWAYWDTISGEKILMWYPGDDPDGDGSDSDSHFDLTFEEGVYFNIPWGATVNNPIGWHGIDDNKSDIDGDVEYDSSRYFPDTFFPKAFKFTFKIYDSKGFIKDGREFTHIIYMD